MRWSDSVSIGDVEPMCDNKIGAVKIKMMSLSLLSFSGRRLWFSIIKSPYFLTSHVNYLKDIKDNNNLLLFKKHSFSILTDITFAEVKHINHNFPVKHLRQELVLASCDGLVCVALRSIARWLVVLWNPSVRKCKIIDEIKDHLGDWGSSESWITTGVDYAVGWHEISNDFRVVKITSRILSREVSIYSLRGDAWHSFVGESVPNIIFAWRHCVLKGGIHWISLAKIVDGVEFRISAFNIVEESFKEIVLPQECYSSTDVFDNGSIVELRGTIAFVSCWLSKCNEPNYCTVWLMKEYGVAESWTKLYTMEMNGMIENPLGFTKSERLICFCKLRLGDMPVVASYNFETRQVQLVEGDQSETSGVVVDFMEIAFLI